MRQPRSNLGFQPLAYSPPWACEVGLPCADGDESFVAYCRRIGIAEAEIDGFLDGLTEWTCEVANARLASHLVRTCPDAFWRAVELLRVEGTRKPLHDTLAPV